MQLRAGDQKRRPARKRVTSPACVRRCFGRSKCEARVKRTAWTNRLQASDRPRRDAASAASKRAPTMREACARSRTFKSSSPADPAVTLSPCFRVTSRCSYCRSRCDARCSLRRRRARRSPAPTPAPAPQPTRVVIQLPTIPLHTEVVVEVNKKGQVVRVKSTKPSQERERSTLKTYGNALQMWIPQEPDGQREVGLYRVTYDYNPEDGKRHAAHRPHLGRRQLGRTNQAPPTS